MAEWLLGLGASLSLTVGLILLYFVVKRRDFYTSDVGKMAIERQKIQFKTAAALSVVALLLFVGIELMEAIEVMAHLPIQLGEAIHALKLVQVTFMLSAQLLMLSIALGSRRGEESGSR